MENDILMKAIKETAEKYVKDNVKVRVYINEDNDKYSRRYGLQLSLNNCFTYYKLSNKYCNSRTYIMRVVSDLCINLAEMAQRKRNDFFKISDENEDLKKQFEVGEQQYNDLVEEKEKLEERISYLERSIERKEETITELELERVPYTNEYVEKVKKENEDLKRQLEYLRSGEYYNQIRFENKMLQDIVDNGKVSKEDKEFIDCTHRNTELLEQQEEFIKYLEDEIKAFKAVSDLLFNSNKEIKVYKEILQKYRKIIGVER